jgi:DNA gyrase/topoisomerase IV subunit A
MKNKSVKLSELAKTIWKEYSIYTLKERAIPSIVDGLKPSQRFILYSAIKSARERYIKVAEIAGNVSSYGYHHGESSAQDAATSMGATWENNYPLLEGDGNFGTRLVQKASAARYIFAKLHKNFSMFFEDTDLCPPHEDEEISIPKHYLPLIPFVLVNGVNGVATGFKTIILPYDAKDITKLTIDYLNGKSIDKKVLIPKFPEFAGRVEKNEGGGFDIIGDYEWVSKTKLLIKEIPYQTYQFKFDRERYIMILDELEENGIINSYEEDHDDINIRFVIKVPRNFEETTNVEKTFKLRATMAEIISVIDESDKLKQYETPIQLIKDFCDIRLKYVDIRIKKTIKTLTEDMALLKSKIQFIEFVISNKISFKNKNKKELTELLKSLSFKVEHIDNLLSMNFYHLTTEEIDKLSEKYLTLNDQLKYFKATTPTIEYNKDLTNLLKQLK